jgi:hypothetical protein
MSLTLRSDLVGNTTILLEENTLSDDSKVYNVVLYDGKELSRIEFNAVTKKDASYLFSFLTDFTCFSDIRIENQRP